MSGRASREKLQVLELGRFMRVKEAVLVFVDVYGHYFKLLKETENCFSLNRISG
jgi:hypothetical protein